ISDPRYRKPLLLVIRLPERPRTAVEGGSAREAKESPQPPVSGPSIRGLCRDRWPVEMLPLAAKQMLGAERAFVFGPEPPQRLPEITLLAGALLMYEATRQPVTRTGFWDRRPQATSGRLRR